VIPVPLLPPPRWNPARVIGQIALGGIAFGIMAGCAGTVPSLDSSGTQSATGVPLPSSTESAPTTVSPTPAPAPVRASPLTGFDQPIAKPVLVVKLDNTRNALPHAGVKKADIVYIEEVEYGITRLAVVFNSRIPNRVGPIRSARITDIDLLSQYGSPGFAFSGAQRKLWPAIAASSMVDLSANKAPNDYQRDRNRRAPYNYFLNAKSAMKSQDDVSLDTNIGFTFSPEVPVGGEINESVRLEWSYASAGFQFDPAMNQYAVFLNGERASAEEGDKLQWADTVVIQLVKQTPSKYFDRGGGNTPHAKTIGKGKALILRDGQSFLARWSRPSPSAGTIFTNELGIPISFKPGQTWVALYDKERKVVVKPKKTSRNTADPTPSPSLDAS
jgi:hypothetical protein